jgi:hypothetical protein
MVDEDFPRPARPCDEIKVEDGKIIGFWYNEIVTIHYPDGSTYQGRGTYRVESTLGGMFLDANHPMTGSIIIDTIPREETTNGD